MNKPDTKRKKKYKKFEMGRESATGDRRQRII
jgi:hypothetical protein